MCDLGLALGLVSGVAQVAAQADAQDKNRQAINDQLRQNYAEDARKRLVQDNEANKQSYQAQLQADRVGSEVKTAGGGMMGSTAAAQMAEQQRQGALSINNAKDSKDAANANYASSTNAAQIEAQNGLNQNTMNPFTAFTEIGASALKGYGSMKFG